MQKYLKKILPLFERYVQWLALVLGVAFMGFMIWTFIYPNNPASKAVTIAKQPTVVTPGTVDPLIHDDAAMPLENKVHQTHPEFQIVVDIPSSFSLPTTRPAATEVAEGEWNSWPFDMNKAVAGTTPKQQQQLVQSLPKLPALKYVDNEPLRTVLAVPTSPGQSVHQDSDSVTTFWSLPIDALAAAFKDSYGTKLPDTAPTVQFVQATLVRQEQNPDGTWGPDVVVGPPTNFPTPPVAYPPPASGQLRQQLAQYKIWMGTAQPEIANPVFPDVALRDRGDLQWQPLDSWVAYRAAQAAAATAAAEAPAAGAAAAPGSSSGAAAGGAFNPVAPLQAAGVATAPPAGGGDLFGTPSATPAAPAAGGATPSATTPGSAAAVPALPKLQLLPATPSSPATLAPGGDLEIYLIDMTAQAGKSYHYKLRYTLYNPVYDQPNHAATPEISDQFGLDSPDSAWSDTITVSPRTRFWCSTKQPGGRARDSEQVAVTVYTWHDGQWLNKDYSPAPGDEIGADEGTGGNFTTQWTLLDVKNTRPGSESRTALVVADASGKSERRDTQLDTTSDDYKKFQHELTVVQPGTPAQAAAQPAQPAAPGARPAQAQAPKPPPPRPAPVFQPPVGNEPDFKP